MPLKDFLLPEFDQEMSATRKTLERIPEDKFDWKPHDKSMTLGRLASHLAKMPTWANSALEKDSLGLAPPSGPPYEPWMVSSCPDVLTAFDKNTLAVRSAVSAADEGRWTTR